MSNNRGVSTPPVGGTPTPAQAESQIVPIDCHQYGKEWCPRGYVRTAPDPQMENPLGATEGQGGSRGTAY